MITKRSKDYVPYLYTQVKYKSMTNYLKTKQGQGVLKLWYQKELFTLNMFSKNKQNKEKQRR